MLCNSPKHQLPQRLLLLPLPLPLLLPHCCLAILALPPVALLLQQQLLRLPLLLLLVCLHSLCRHQRLLVVRLATRWYCWCCCRSCRLGPHLL
jgi:hypothetical protein